MAIPDYQQIMLPLLKFAGDKEEHTTREVTDHISKFFKLNENEKKELLSSGQQTIIYNRVGWARTYLKKSGLLESTRRGYFRITKSGLEVLERNPPEIDVKYLEQFPEFADFKTSKRQKKQEHLPLTPLEMIEDGYEKINSELAQELLRLVKNSQPDFFEKLVVDLLLKMGYGGSLREAGMAIGKIGDEGIDGIIKEDKLGLDNIYIQAKKWEGTVGRPEIQKFVGALKGRKAKKGIFITSSNFSENAKDYAERIDDPRLVLIDGEQLGELLIDNTIGVSTITTYRIKKIHMDYFSEE